MPIKSVATLLAFVLSRQTPETGYQSVVTSDNTLAVATSGTSSSFQEILKMFSNEQNHAKKMVDFVKMDEFANFENLELLNLTIFPRQESQNLLVFRTYPQVTVGDFLANEKLVREFARGLIKHVGKQSTRRLQDFNDVDSLVEAVQAGESLSIDDTISVLLSSDQPNQALIKLKNSLLKHKDNTNIKNYSSILLKSIQDNNPCNWLDDLDFEQVVLTEFTSALQYIANPENSQTTTVTVATEPATAVRTTSNDKSNPTTGFLVDTTTGTSQPATMTKTKDTSTDTSTTTTATTTRSITESISQTTNGTTVRSCVDCDLENGTITTTITKTNSQGSTTTTTTTTTIPPELLPATNTTTQQPATVTNTTTGEKAVFISENGANPEHSPNGNENEASSHAGAIAGGVTGGVAFLVTAAVAAIYWKRRQEQPVAEQSDLERGENDSPAPHPRDPSRSPASSRSSIRSETTSI